jgi:FAD dependent oxidoreductase
MTVNSLAVLAYKVAPNMFDLSTGLAHVSLRDQVIRGATLVRDLVAAKLLVSGDEILIVGAGAAGVSAARHAALAGCTALVIEKAATPFGLQSGVTTRYVGPYMYEWPWDIHADQHFAPPPTSILHHWNTAAYAGLEVVADDPLTAETLADQWRKQLETWVLDPHSNLTVLTAIDAVNALANLKRWRRSRRFFMPGAGKLRFDGTRWPKGSQDSEFINPKFIILAAGFGPERVTWTGPLPQNLYQKPKQVRGPDFWKSDNLSQPYCGFEFKPTVVVLGGGDGALQDALRCLYPRGHPLQVLQDLFSFGGVESAFKETHADILLAEQQHAATRTWTSGASQPSEFESLQKAYLSIIERLSILPAVQDAVLGCLRTDVARVVLVVRERTLGKAYSLNRFLVLLLNECLKRCAAPGRVDFELRFDSEVTDISGAAPHYHVEVRDPTLPAVYSIPNVAHLSIRFGVEGDKAPGQLMGITKTDTKNRRELVNIPQSLWPIP